ncbi:hypothetical protein BHM03_00022753 [Ensete ventricosum]|nr:hypothetical protein BHM03_00022753 [Ensete ventricosum]
MLPLRFPNSGIRAKATRSGGQPPVGPTTYGQVVAKAPPAREADTARRSNNLQGRLKPFAGVAARRDGACRHGWLRPARSGGNRPRADPLAACRLQRGLAAGCPQGAATSGQPYRQ